MNTRSSQRLLSVSNGLSLRSGRELDVREDDSPKMRIGLDYQASLPELHSSQQTSEGSSTDHRSKAILLWKPTDVVQDDALEEFLKIAYDRCNYSNEQALGLLFMFQYDMTKALSELQNYVPFEEEWTKKDKVLFEQAYQKHGKVFHRIRAMLPEKTIGSLVKYYYQWKKEHSRLSMMDKKAQKRKIWYHTSNDAASKNEQWKGKRLPKGVYLTESAFLKAADDKKLEAIRKLDIDIKEMYCKIQEGKQKLSQDAVCYLEKDEIELLRPSNAARRNQTLALWTSVEIEKAVEALRSYGDNIETMSAEVGTKSPQQCSVFMVHYKRRYNISTLLEDYKRKSKRQQNPDDVFCEGETPTRVDVLKPIDLPLMSQASFTGNSEPEIVNAAKRSKFTD